MFDKIVADSSSIITESTMENIFVDVRLDRNIGNVLDGECVLGRSSSAHGSPGDVALGHQDEVILVLVSLAAVQGNHLDIDQFVLGLGVGLHAVEQWILVITERADVSTQGVSLEMLQQRLQVSVFTGTMKAGKS